MADRSGVRDAIGLLRQSLHNPLRLASQPVLVSQLVELIAEVFLQTIAGLVPGVEVAELFELGHTLRKDSNAQAV